MPGGADLKPPEVEYEVLPALVERVRSFLEHAFPFLPFLMLFGAFSLHLVIDASEVAGPLCGKCQALAERGEAYPTCRERNCEKCIAECCKPEHDRCCCLHRDVCECPPPPQPLTER